MSERLHYASGGPRVPAPAMHTFAAAAFAAVGVPDDDAAFVAQTLVHADLRGVHSHGLRLMPGYLDQLADGVIEAAPTIQNLSTAPGAAALAGDRSLGQIGARAGMRAAIDIARQRGAGAASVADTGHFGAAAFWALQAADAGLIGMATSNMAGPCMLAHGSREPASGNTPLAWAFPSGDPYPTVLDMAAGAYALGKLHLAATVSDTLPAGAAADADGAPTTSAAQLAYVLPAGGPKGYGVGLAHDLIAGVLSGDGATLTKGPYDPAAGPRGSLFFMAIDVEAFLPLRDFHAAMRRQTDAVNALPPAEGVTRVQMPGQPEWDAYRTNTAHGIAYPPGVLESLTPAAARLDLPTPWRP